MNALLTILKEIFKFDWLKVWMSFKLEIRTFFTAIPLTKSFCKIHWLKVVDVCQRPIPSLCKLHSFYIETEVDSYFHHNVFDISQSQHWIVCVSRGSTKNSFALKLFHFCNLKTKQRSILQEDVNLFIEELRVLVDSLRNFPKIYV